MLEVQTSRYWTQSIRYEAALREVGLSCVLDSPEMQRLRHVSFLGTIDFISAIRRPFSRYDHAVGVAGLALTYADKVRLRSDDRLILILACALHDIGHAPLSHVTETLLLERMRRYHEGIGSALVRKTAHESRVGEGSLRSRILAFGEGIYDGVCRLIAGRNVLPGVADLFHGATSFDSFDGITRTAWCLYQDSMDPTELATLFEMKAGRVMLPRKRLGRLQQFWSLQHQIYQDHIYTQGVLAAEAMITRAVELSIRDNREDVVSFSRYTDSQAWDLMSSTGAGRLLVTSLKEGALFRGLASVDPKLSSSIREKIDSGGGRFMFKLRRQLEQRIAELIGVPAELVITHYSFTRTFSGSYLTGKLTRGTEGEEDCVYKIRDVCKMFYTKRMSGRRFDVFVPPPKLNHIFVPKDRLDRFLG